MRTFTLWATLSCCGACLLSASASLAGGRWSHTTSYKYARQSAIRVVEPQGFTATVGDRSDGIPAIFVHPNANAYVWVTVRAKDGATWRNKIEVRDHQETILRLRYDQAAQTRRSSGKTHIGRVSNLFHKCGAGRRRTHVRFDFIKDGSRAKSIALAPGRYQPNVEMAAGTYDVRIFVSKRGQFVFTKTRSGYAIDKDGWHFWFGCR